MERLIFQPRAMTGSASLVLRPSTAQDLPPLAALLTLPLVAAGYFGTPGSTTLVMDTLTRNLAEAATGRGEVWVACANHRPAALLAYAAVVDNRLAYFVHPRRQGQGLATAMASWACARAFDARPGTGIGAWVFRENRASVTVLERLAFRFTGLYRPAVAGCHQPMAMLGFELDAREHDKARMAGLPDADALQPWSGSVAGHWISSTCLVPRSR
ncbi:MAG: GNAT family N-acetyltransferase [Paucibacter sp.]|nr:GNAT family N-acetyltransferase [Roseateles sp.]